ncbi:glycine betaine ABC transporter substrate-binding protein [Dethiobacter alkaliphilus]|uniref:glycine betaine ABC transporter substrate-binding protein n=1 Tax=Dethiobacter alkaliphilus TaxID=427926 RepID=UPI0023EEF709|nr:glycine betaine ABC transporter substrate-binding protein [Dethiobacter alkaliphilus]
MGFFEMLIARRSDVLLRIVEHLQLSFVAMFLAVAIAVPIGIYLTRSEKLANPVIGVAGVFQTIPSLALVALMVPFIGIGFWPAIIALFLYSLLPILRNTYTGIKGVNPALKEAGRGMGMTDRQVLVMVELPLALPVIMAGIRTAVVLIVGAATLATLIGAGGLGEFIFRGLAMSIDSLILLGAIPAALLAILVERALGTLEHHVTPLGLRDNPGQAKAGATPIKIAGLALAVILALGVALQGIWGMFGEQTDITIGSKNFTENILLGHMMASLIEEHTDLTVERSMNMGGTEVNHQAMLRGDIDMYAEYTGTGLMAILDQEPISDPERVYQIVSEEYEERFQMEWLQPFGFNNTYTLTVRREMAEELNLETFSDLIPHSENMDFGATHEFLERPDGLQGLQEVYPGLEFASTRGLDPGLTYTAVAQGDVDCIDAFSTDGRIPALDLFVLEDDRQFFPPYFAAPVIRQDVLLRFPEIREVLEMLSGFLDDETMAQLNFAVDETGRSAQGVAEEFLREKGLLQ